MNSLPNDKILDYSNFKALANDKINLTNNLKLVLRMVQNILRKGENDGYQYFLLFPKYFQRSPSLGVFKSRDCVVRVNPLPDDKI